MTEKIQSSETHMHSRVYFTLRTVGLVALSILILSTSALIVNFILLSVHMNSTHELLGFGSRGWEAFLQFFPWGLLVVDVVSVVFLVALLHTFRLGYRVPLVYVFGILLFVVVIVGVIMERHTPMNTLIDREMRGPGMHQGMMGGMWNRMHAPPPPGEGVCRCEIISMETNGRFTARDVFSGVTYQVIVSGDTPYATTTGLTVGDRVYLAGDSEGDVLTVFGLKKGGDGRRWGMDR